MKGSDISFWAKKEESYGLYKWLPLSQHLEDTRKVSGLLWEHWLSESQRKQIRKALDEPAHNGLEDKAKGLVQFLGAIHDFGKATPAFQRMSHGDTADLDARLWERLESEGFKDLSSARLDSSKETHHSLAGQKLLKDHGVEDDISSIIGGHHGRPIDSEEKCENQEGYPANYYQAENRQDPLNQKWREEQERIFEWALKISGFSKVEDLPKVTQATQVILSGLLIMADWIASNTDYFPLIPLEETEIHDQEGRVQTAWQLWLRQREKWDPRSISDQEIYSNISKIYHDRFGFASPRGMQSIFARIIKDSDDPGIFILEAPMGEGKTEAALVAAELLAWKTGAGGVFFGLPTQATSNGIFPRIEEWLEKVSKVDEVVDMPYRPRLVHGKAALNESTSNRQRNEQAENIDVDSPTNGNVAINEWFSGRKTAMLDDFVVATIDQFLMLALKQKHLALRHLGFSKKVIIIDEVHAYDAYMSQYLYMAVTWMAAYGVPVIVLSATLPADKREELVKSYIRGTGRDWRYDVIKPEHGLKTNAYPLITYTDGKQVAQFTDFEGQPGKEVEIRPLEEGNLQDLIRDQYEAGGVLGIILNTVKRAQELADVCITQYGKENVMLLHSRFITTDRIAKEKELIGMIGKGAKRPEKKIIIGTQVIEQSLDIDFDVMISDLAPMDLLIQRIGRLHRHAATRRPEYHRRPVLHVLGTDRVLDFESGSRAVYGEYLLARTQYFLPDILALPDDISRLVQLVYDEDVPINYEEDQQTEYEAMKKDHSIVLTNKKLKADGYRISKPLLKPGRRGNSLIGWLKNTSENESDERAYAQVRDTSETIEVIALKQTGEGYGIFGTNEDLSGKVHSSHVAKEIAKHTVNLPGAFSAPYQIDKTIDELEKYNHIHLKEWQQQAWLKSALGVIFDGNNEFQLNGFSLRYDLEFGLRFEELKDGKI